MSKTFEQGKAEVAGLCDYFAKNQAAFSAPERKEAHVRQDLIDPLFRALGWDVGNAARVAPQYCEVIVEDSLDVEGQQKAPDYTFRVGTLPKFFTEAKKCGVNIFGDPAPAYQLRRYGWSAKVAVSILTDFEEMGVYDCTLRPRPGDKATHARILYYRFDEYPERWRELWDIFSHEAVWSGGFDQYAASKRKRGTSEVDAEFLKELEGWRDELARNIALRNRNLSGEELNRAVQLTIDRVVFLRMAEDRGLEPYDQLLTLCERADVYARFMRELCRKADDRYNSGLFHFQKESGVSEAPDRITPQLAVDDKVFKPILQSLYFAHGSPYEFKVLPVEILGTVYERFLGKVIRLTAGHQAKIEEKPEVRKAGGVYYTPAYIVDYIVKHTVGRQIEGRSPAQLAGKGKKQPLRVLDMACGSGSFLLGAYQCLLDHCLKWYIANGPEGFPRAAYQHATAKRSEAGWRLTIAEKKRILLSHIFGVDIDPQAVEVSKLSLLLKVLEGESAETVGNTMRLFHERALPNLSGNIKCGNSLIGPDYFTGRLIPDAEEFARVNAFDWKREFPAAMKAGGFDCVIGNPPWGADLPATDIEFFKANYRVANCSILDSYALFLEKGKTCLAPGGYLGFITPDTYLRKDELLETRRFILEETAIQKLIETGPVFSQVRDTWCLIVVLCNAKSSRSHTICHMQISRSVTAAEDRLLRFSREAWDADTRVPQTVWQRKRRSIIGYLATEPCQDLIEKMEKWPALGELSGMFRVSRGEEGSKLAISGHAAGKFFMVLPKDVERYSVADGIRVSGTTLTQSKTAGLYTHPKIWIIRIQKMRWRQRIVCALDTRDNSAGMKTLQIVVSPTDDIQALAYLQGILASRLVNFWCENYLADDMNQSYLERIPIPGSPPVGKALEGTPASIASLADRMVTMQKQPSTAKSAAHKDAIQRQIEATDAEIDRLVYDLYALTKDEIAIVDQR